MDYELLRIEEKCNGQLVQATLGHAPANIISSKMMGEISGLLDEAEKAPHKKMIVFRGEGKHFSFGASVEEHNADRVGDMLPIFHTFIGKLLECNIPTLAQVSGLCLGGAFELALACTFIFADETAKLGLPEIQLAVFPPPATILLPLRCGDALASRIILTGEQLSATELHEGGVINKVVEAGKLDDAVSEFFEKQIAPKSASSLRIATRASRMTTCEHYRTFIGKIEDMYLKELMSTKDANEGIQSFLEKRKPVWMDE